MKPALPSKIVRGVIAGALVGLLVGAYVCILSADYVIRRSDYITPIAYEGSQTRYGTVLSLAFCIVFTAIGAVVASASFGLWIRHAVYGLVATLGVIVVITLACAALFNQQPFNQYKTASSSFIDLARYYLVPLAFVIGPVIGILIRRNCSQWHTSESNNINYMAS